MEKILIGLIMLHSVPLSFDMACNDKVITSQPWKLKTTSILEKFTAIEDHHEGGLSCASSHDAPRKQSPCMISSRPYYVIVMESISQSQWGINQMSQISDQDGLLVELDWLSAHLSDLARFCCIQKINICKIK